MSFEFRKRDRPTPGPSRKREGSLSVFKKILIVGRGEIACRDYAASTSRFTVSPIFASAIYKS